MSPEPTPVAGPLAEEIRARKATQGIRAERARFGQQVRELGNTCPECGPAGAGGGDAGMHQGYVPVTREIADPASGEVKVDPRTGETEVLVEWRPCFTCNPERWRAWQEGTLHSSSRARVESAEDRQLQQQERRQREQQSWA